MDEKLFRIGEIAAFFGVSVKAMRVYEKMGILKPIKVDEHTGYRYYTADHIRQLDALLELKYFGFSLSEIQKLLSDGPTNEKYMESLVHKKLAWQEKIADLQHRIENIDEAIKKLENAKPPTKIHELTQDEQALLLSRLSSLESLQSHTQGELSQILWL